MGSLGTVGTFKVLGSLEATDRFAMVVVVVLVHHVDGTVVGMKLPMSNFLYFLLFWDFLLLFLPNLFSLTGVQGFKLLLFIFNNLLPKGRKGLHLPDPGAI